VFRGNRDEIRPKQPRHEGIDDEAVLRNHDIHTGGEECVPDELDDFIRAVAEDEVRLGDAKLRGEALFELVRAAVRIEVQLGQGVLYRFQRGGRWAKRVLIGRQLDDFRLRQAEFARDFLDGPPRLIDGQVLERRIDGVGQVYRRFSPGRRWPAPGYSS
jgi:hypothetical protein